MDVNHGHELREENHVDKVRAKDEQTVNRLHEQTHAKRDGANDDDGGAQNPDQLGLRGL